MRIIFVIYSKNNSKVVLFLVNIMAGKMRRLIIILTLISISLTFSINGPWKLEVDSSFKNITQNASIIFDFSR